MGVDVLFWQFIEDYWNQEPRYFWASTIAIALIALIYSCNLPVFRQAIGDGARCLLPIFFGVLVLSLPVVFVGIELWDLNESTKPQFVDGPIKEGEIERHLRYLNAKQSWVPDLEIHKPYSSQHYR